MAETLDDNFKAEMLDFKTQMLRFVEIANQKFDGIASDLRGNSIRLDKVEHRIGNVDDRLGNVEGRLGDVEKRLGNVEGKVEKLSGDVRQLSGQFRDVARKVMDNHSNVATIDERVTILEAEAH